MIRAVLALLLLPLAGCAGTSATSPGQKARDEARLARMLDGFAPDGPAQSCLRRDRVREIRGAGEVLVFVESRDRLWRNAAGPGCEGIARGDILVTTLTGDQYCRGDIVRTHDRFAGPAGSCGLGDFVPFNR